MNRRNKMSKVVLKPINSSELTKPSKQHQQPLLQQQQQHHQPEPPKQQHRSRLPRPKPLINSYFDRESMKNINNNNSSATKRISSNPRPPAPAATSSIPITSASLGSASFNNNYNNHHITQSIGAVSSKTASESTTTITNLPPQTHSYSQSSWNLASNNNLTSSSTLALPKSRLINKHQHQQQQLKKMSIPTSNIGLNDEKKLPVPHNHRHPRLTKYHYHMKNDKVYGDKKLKLCGQCIQPGHLSNDLRQLNRFINRPSIYDEDGVDQSSNNSNYAYAQQPKLSRSVGNPLGMSASRFAELSSIDLRVLDLTTERQTDLNVPLRYLPAELFRFKQLHRLHLDCNEIKVIPDSLGENLVNLQVLTLSSNHLRELPNSLSNLAKLESLHLSNNRFREFPMVLCEMFSLTFLDLSSNHLTELPDELGDLERLESLLLFQNELKELPKSLGKLVNLRTLWFGNNKITRLPRELLNLRYLGWEDDGTFNLSTILEGNPLEEPPHDICQLGLAAIRDYFMGVPVAQIKGQQKKLPLPRATNISQPPNSNMKTARF